MPRMAVSLASSTHAFLTCGYMACRFVLTSVALGPTPVATTRSGRLVGMVSALPLAKSSTKDLSMQTVDMHLTSYSCTARLAYADFFGAASLGPLLGDLCHQTKGTSLYKANKWWGGGTWSFASLASWPLVRQNRNTAALVHATSATFEANLATASPPTSTPVAGRNASYLQGCAFHSPIKEQSYALLPECPWQEHARSSANCQQSVDTAGSSPA